MKKSLRAALSGIALIERLDERRLFAAMIWSTSLTSDGHLTLKGTARADKPVIFMEPMSNGEGAQVTIRGNGNPKAFRNVTGLSVLTRGGNDVVTITGPDMSDIDCPVFIYTDRDNDTVYIRDFSGRVTADGGEGDDRLSAKKAFRWSAVLGPESGITMYGSDGDDVLVGSDADDRLYGGWGDDTLIGYAGDDILDAGFGSNEVYGGDGDDTIYLQHDAYDPASQLIDGGADNDTIFRTIYGPAGNGEIKDRVYGVEDVFSQTIQIGGGEDEEDDGEDEFEIPSGKG